MFEVSGVDKLSRDLDKAQEALHLIDGELCTVSFNPDDPASIEAAIQQVEAIIDERLATYSSNPIISPLMAGLKEKYRDGILERAASARLGGQQG